MYEVNFHKMKVIQTRFSITFLIIIVQNITNYKESINIFFARYINFIESFFLNVIDESEISNKIPG